MRLCSARLLARLVCKTSNVHHRFNPSASRSPAKRPLYLGFRRLHHVLYRLLGGLVFPRSFGLAMTGGKAVQVVFAANNSAYRSRKRAHRACEQCKSRRVCIYNSFWYLIPSSRLTATNRKNALRRLRTTSVVRAVLKMEFIAGYGYFPLNSHMLTDRQ